ncbi:hypothetical protein ALC53_02852, partial [Atta colombica]
TVTREGERKTVVAARRRAEGERQQLVKAKWSPGGPPPRSCRRCFPVDQKRSRGKRNARGGGGESVSSNEERTKIMNTHACTHQGGTSFTASHRDRPVKEDTPLRCVRRAAPPLPRQMFPPLRCGDHCPFFFSPLRSEVPFFAAERCTSPNLALSFTSRVRARGACFQDTEPPMKYFTFLLQQL